MVSPVPPQRRVKERVLEAMAALRIHHLARSIIGTVAYTPAPPPRDPQAPVHVPYTTANLPPPTTSFCPLRL